LGFDILSDNAGETIVNTDWFLRRSFPVFVMNAVRYLGGIGSATTATVRPGSPVALRTETPVDRMTVQRPDGKRSEVMREGQRRFVFADTVQLGVYKVFEGKSRTTSRQFAVNLFDARESDLTPRTDVQLGYREVKGTAAPHAEFHQDLESLVDAPAWNAVNPAIFFRPPENACNPLRERLSCGVRRAIELSQLPRKSDGIITCKEAKMPYSMFFEHFPEIAGRETRTVTLLRKSFGLAPGDYAVLEMFCDEPGCDCRRVMFCVVSSHTKDVEAVVAYGWESRDFYAEWMHDDDPDVIDELQGPILNLASPQSKLAPAILELIETVVLRDGAYIERVKRHYALFREKVDGKRLSAEKAIKRRKKKQRARRRTR
jgi:hypothetical protein